MPRRTRWIAPWLLGLATAAGISHASTPLLAAAAHVTSARETSWELQSLITEVRDPSLRTRLHAAHARLDHDLQVLEGLVVRQETRRPLRPAPVAVTSAAELAPIVAAVEGESFEDDKLRVLRAATAGRWFTTAQVVRLMESFPFSNGRIETAVTLHGQVVDPENWYLVYGALTFGSDKEELERRLGIR